MATLQDLTASAVINIFSVLAFLLAFALLRIQPINDRVYFPKWFINGTRKSPARSGGLVGKFVNLNFMTYVKFLNWMPEAIKMSEKEIIEHAGVDSAAYLRIFLFGLKLFVPMTILAIVVLVPINLYSKSLASLQNDLTYSDIDKLSISNIKSGSQRFWIHLLLAYTFTLWTCYLLFHEYNAVASMRLKFLASQNRRVDQFTVIVRNVPCVSGVLISENVERFFRTNHPDHYLCHQLVYDANKLTELESEKEGVQNWLDYYQLKYERHPEARPTCKTSCFGFCGRKVDSIDFYRRKIEELQRKIITEHQRILKDPNAIMPVAFVSFHSRWAAAVCAQTQQSKNPILWLTDWAPEPRDVYWQNLAIPFVSLSIRRLIMLASLFALVFFYMIPVAFVQSLANLDGLEKAAPFLRPVIELKAVKSFIQGYLPGLILNLFLLVLPTMLMAMSKVEGYISVSKLERQAAAKYYYFMLVNVFFGSIITGTAFQQLYSFLHQPPTEIPGTIGVSIPMKATFFMTYIMVDGWAGVAGEILRLKPLVIYHLKNMFLVKTEKDREQAMEPASIGIPENLPKLQLYFLLGLVYAVVTPILLPFIVIFFCFAYLVYRHQVINVYVQLYESIAAFWPYFHGRIIASLIISQFLLMGVLSTKKAASSTPLLTLLPLLTFWFHKYCKRRFEPAFRKYPLEEAMSKDMIERAAEPNLNLRAFLSDAYLHPIFRAVDDLEMGRVREGGRNGAHETSPMTSELSSPSPQYVFHHEVRSSHKTGSVRIQKERS